MIYSMHQNVPFRLVKHRLPFVTVVPFRSFHFDTGLFSFCFVSTCKPLARPLKTTLQASLVEPGLLRGEGEGLFCEASLERRLQWSG